MSVSPYYSVTQCVRHPIFPSPSVCVTKSFSHQIFVSPGVCHQMSGHHYLPQSQKCEFPLWIRLVSQTLIPGITSHRKQKWGFSLRWVIIVTAPPPPKWTFFRGGNVFLSFFIIIFLSFLVKKAASCVFEQVGNIFPLTFLIKIHNIFFWVFFEKNVNFSNLPHYIMFSQNC